MVIELADLTIVPGKQAEFDEAIERGLVTVIAKAEGCRGWKVGKGIETPERYLLTIYWDSFDNHMVDFREGPLFPQWRAIVGPFFAQPPRVEHFTLVTER